MNAFAHQSLEHSNILPPAAMLRALSGVLIGTAVGDSLGLPFEGMSAQRQDKLRRRPLQQQLVGRFGMVSDDTEHTWMVSQSLLNFPGSVDGFQRSLASALRWWLLRLPAGVGLATLRAILKLWVGISPRNSGVFSAGNGPAMRSAVLGVYFWSDPDRCREYVRASTRLTHSDPRAEIGAWAVAVTAAWMTQQRDDIDTLLKSFAVPGNEEWTSIVQKLGSALESANPLDDLSTALGISRGVSGYVFQSVPIALCAAIYYRNDFEKALTSAIQCGGDTDTVAAITGALVGARVGSENIPQSWVNNVVDWPCSPTQLRKLAENLALQSAGKIPCQTLLSFWPAVIVRNIIFLMIVLAHGFRRLLPPY